MLNNSTQQGSCERKCWSDLVPDTKGIGRAIYSTPRSSNAFPTSNNTILRVVIVTAHSVKNATSNRNQTRLLSDTQQIVRDQDTINFGCSTILKAEALVGSIWYSRNRRRRDQSSSSYVTLYCPLDWSWYEQLLLNRAMPGAGQIHL